MPSPTERSLKLLRNAGWRPWVVERWIPRANKRLDLWNFGDILALKEMEHNLIVQTTTLNNVKARLKKIEQSEEAQIWLANGDLIEVHGWGKLARGWVARIWVAGVTLCESGREAKHWSIFWVVRESE